MRAAPDTPPIQVAIRGLLGCVLIAAYVVWGWHVGGGGIPGVVLALVLASTAASAWAVFRTRGEPPGRHAIVAVGGRLRLVIEVAIIGIGAYGLWVGWNRSAAETMLTAFGVHSALTWERLVWLWRAGSPGSREAIS